MNKIDQGYDNLLCSNYELHSVQLSELKTLAKSWYEGVDLTKFDNRYISNIERLEREEGNFIEMKKSGLTSNYFFAYKEDDKFYLMDGFNRLFTDYGKIDIDCTVYLKILVDKLEDHQLMHIMFRLNMWKLQGDHQGGFKPNDFFDRGFRLLISKKFDINLFTYTNKEYESRLRDREDIRVIYHYFRNELEFSGAFSFDIKYLSIIFKNKRIVEDLVELIKINNYRNKPFKNYEMFVDGFAMFIAWRRASGDESEYKFQTYLDKLHEDKKFFKKLQGMSGTDSTRINIYHFFRGLKK